MKLRNSVSICLLAMAVTANAAWAQSQATTRLTGPLSSSRRAAEGRH